MRSVLLVLLATLGVLSCSSGPGCEDVAAKLLELAPEDKKSLLTREQLVASCENERPSSTERACIVAAKTFTDAAKCDPRAKAAAAAKETKP